MSVTLYYGPGACSLASHIALEEIGLRYDTVRLDLAAGDQRKPEYLKINPRGRVPACVVDGRVITDIVGILSYFAGRYPKAGIWPQDTWHQALAISTTAWLSNTVHTAFAHLVLAARYVDGDDHQEAVKAKARSMYEATCTRSTGCSRGASGASAIATPASTPTSSSSTAGATARRCRCGTTRTAAR